MSTGKLISTPHYHVWTDALHARALAKQTKNEWDRGSYVRWCIISAWAAFEMACEDAVGVNRLGTDFRRKMDEAVGTKNVSSLSWDHGIWQRVYAIYAKRKKLVHVASNSDLSQTGLPEAESTLATLREAIVAIYAHVNKSVPMWQEDNDDAGWTSSGSRASGNLSLRAGVRADDPNRIEIRYVSKGHEHVSDVLPPKSAYMPYVQKLKESLRCETSAIRIYEAGQLIDEDKEVKNHGIRGI